MQQRMALLCVPSVPSYCKLTKDSMVKRQVQKMLLLAAFMVADPILFLFLANSLVFSNI